MDNNIAMKDNRLTIPKLKSMNFHPITASTATQCKHILGIYEISRVHVLRGNNRKGNLGQQCNGDTRGQQS